MCSKVKKQEAPGEFPYTRGIWPNMYKDKLWTMRQYSGFGSAKETNKRFKYLIDAGQTGLSIAFDLPTQIGYDPDHELSKGEVGKVGVSISTLADMEELFSGINLGDISTSMTINSTASILLAMYIALTKKQNVSVDKLRGTIQNDILKEYVSRGTYRFPIDPSMRLIGDIFEYCGENLQKWNTISVSGYHMREAGSTAAQEIAFTLSNAITYSNLAKNKGLDINKFLKRLSFFFNSHNDFFEEIAKFRASRRLWANICKKRFNANDDACKLRFHTQTAGSTLTSKEPLNNVVRVAMQALAAVLGGTQSLHTNSFDEALSLPTDEAVKVALRTQQLLAYESGIKNYVDPVGDSSLILDLTNKLEKESLELIEKIDKMGGSAEAVKNGYIANAIHASSYEYQKKVEIKEKIVVGVNKFADGADKERDLFKHNPKIEKQVLGKLSRIKEERKQKEVKDSLEVLKSKAKTNENLVPYIIKACENYASIGEICNELSQVFGEQKDGGSNL